MRTPVLRLMLCLMACLGLTHCRSGDTSLDGPLELLAPVSAGGGLFYVERTRGLSLFLDLTGARPTVRRSPVGANPVLSTARIGHDELLVLSRGQRGDVGVEPQPGTLTALPAIAGTAARSYEVRSPFNALSQTPDGRFALAYFKPESASGRLLYNPNEIAVVDLDAPPSATNPVSRTVRSFGGVPNSVVFSPPLTFRGEPRVLALVLSDAYVTLLDLAHLDRPEITVRLTLPEDLRAIRPTQVLFDVASTTAYIRAELSNDLYVLQLADGAPSLGPSDFTVSINQLAAGQQPSDIALFGPSNGTRVLVTSPGSRDARVVDARSNTVTTLPLAARADRILIFDGGSPRDPTITPRALLYSTDGATRSVSFVDLTEVESRRGRNVETVQLNRAIVGAQALPERNALMLQHPPGGSADGSISLLDLTYRTAAPIYAEVSLASANFDADRRTLWVAPQGSLRLGFIDLATFHPGEVRLDQPCTDAIPLVGDPMGRNRVVAVHAGSEGDLTLLDSTLPSRDTALSIRGFVLTGLLEGNAL